MIGLCQCGCGQYAPIAERNDSARGWVKGQPIRFIRFHAARVQPRIAADVSARFWAKAQVAADSECWPWIPPVKRGGYGQFSIGGRMVRAHRVAWTLAHGVIPAGLSVCHKCDNPRCVNPSHLFVGTHTDNMRDMAAKGRCVIPTGEAHHCRKLLIGDVARIRVRLSEGARLSALAREYGVTPQSIYSIKIGKSWRSVA